MRSEALRSIQQSLHSGDGSQGGLFIIAVCSALMLLVLVRVFASQWKRRRQLVQRWRRFSEGMSQHALSAPQRALMIEMARREAPDDPGSLLQGLEVFERAVHHHLRPLMSGGGPAALERAAVHIRGMRQALGFCQPKGTEYHSTRELQQGQEVQLYATPDARTPVAHARVGEPREDFMDLVDLRSAGPIEGRSVHVVFYSRGRRYRFPSDLLEMDPARSVCRLAHSIGVRAVDPREHFRVESQAPLSIRADWEPVDAWRAALLRNLSAGGAALVSGFFYEPGEQLMLQVPAPVANGQDRAERRIGATILEARKLTEDRCLYRVEFRDVAPEDRRYLFRVVQSLQLHSRPAAA